MAHRFKGRPSHHDSVLKWYGTPTAGYHDLNTKYSAKPTQLPPPVDAVHGGCWVGDSQRNQDTIFNFISGERDDELQMIVFLAGHAGIINPHKSEVEPKLDIACYTCYFNYAGELSSTPSSANATSDAFMTGLTQETSKKKLSKKNFFGFLNRFKETHITTGSPLSLYAPSTRMDDSYVLCAGGIAPNDIGRDHQGNYIIPRNPASVLMFVKSPTGDRVVDLTLLNPAIINIWQQRRGDLQVHLKADRTGFEFDIAPYLYLNSDGTYRNVMLSDIYELIKVFILQMQPDTIGTHIMNEFMYRHVVLVSLGCRILADGTVYRVESVPRLPSVSPESLTSRAPSSAMDEAKVAALHQHGFLHWPLPTQGSGSSVSVSRPGGGKKKQRRRQTRNRKYKMSKKKYTKRSRR